MRHSVISESNKLLRLSSSIVKGKPLTSDQSQLVLEIDTELKVFEDRGGWWGRLFFYSKMVLPSLLLATSNTGCTLFNGFGLYIADKSGTPQDIGGLGLTFFIFSAVVYPTMQGIAEKVGIVCAQNWGKREIDAMKENFLRGLLLLLVASSLFFFAVILPLDRLLIAIQIDPKIAVLSGSYARLIYTFECIRNLRMLFINFVIAQGLDLSHSTHTTVSLLIAAPISAYLGLWKGWSVLGWIVGRAVLDLSQIALLIISYLIEKSVGRIKMTHFSNCFSNLWDFFSDVIIFSVSVYTESIGWEMSTLVITQTGDSTQIAAFTLLTNISNLTWHIGNGFTCMGRAKINYLLGMEKFVQAKRAFGTILLGNCTMCSLLGLVLFFCRSHLAALYSSSSPEVLQILSRLLHLYSFLMVGDFLYSYIFTVTRSVHQTCLNFSLNLTILVACHSSISFYWVKKRSGNCYTALLFLELSLILIHAIMILRFFSMDWIEVLSNQAHEPEHFQQLEEYSIHILQKTSPRRIVQDRRLMVREKIEHETGAEIKL